MSSRYYIYDSYTDSVAEFAEKNPVPKKTADRLSAAINRGRGSYGRAVTAAMTPTSQQSFKGGALRELGNRTRNVWKSGKVGKAGLLGAGLSAAGVVAGGGYAMKRRADRKAQERNSIKGRVKRLLGR